MLVLQANLVFIFCAILNMFWPLWQLIHHTFLETTAASEPHQRNLTNTISPMWQLIHHTPLDTNTPQPQMINQTCWICFGHCDNWLTTTFRKPPRHPNHTNAITRISVHRCDTWFTTPSWTQTRRNPHWLTKCVEYALVIVITDSTHLSGNHCGIRTTPTQFDEYPCTTLTIDSPHLPGHQHAATTND